MTSTDPIRNPDWSEDPDESVLKQDPWGVRRVENLITSLQGVLSARVVVSPVGEVTEVHVLTQGGTAPKQVVRNVESALLAHLGLKVDHRKISVAQTTEVSPLEALEENAVNEKAIRRWIIFRKLEVLPGRPDRVKFGVTMDVKGEEYSAEEESADTQSGRIRAAARAALTVLDKVLPTGTVELDGVKVVEAFESHYVFVAVHIIDGRQRRVVTGTCQITDSAEQAAVLAVLDATNRWVRSRL